MTIKTYKPYSIVVVPFPFTDTKQFKKRPALVISNETDQKHNIHITLMMITSAKHSKWHSDYLIADLNGTGLANSSYIRFKIFTLDLRLIIKQIGSLVPQDQAHMQNLLKKHFSL